MNQEEGLSQGIVKLIALRNPCTHYADCRVLRRQMWMLLHVDETCWLSEDRAEKDCGQMRMIYASGAL